MAGTRLNLLGGAAERAAEPRVAAALARCAAGVRPAVASLPRLLAELDDPAAGTPVRAAGPR